MFAVYSKKKQIFSSELSLYRPTDSRTTESRNTNLCYYMQSSGKSLRATDTSEHAHATEPQGPGQPDAPAPPSRRRQLPREILRWRAVVAAAVREIEPVGRRTPDGEPAALRLQAVAAAAAVAVEARPRVAGAGDDEALVVVAVRRLRPPLPERRADEREDPLHCLCRSLGLKQQRPEIFLFACLVWSVF